MAVYTDVAAEELEAFLAGYDIGALLSYKGIAEGVENEAQMSFLRGHQCDEVPGYYISKPLAVDKVSDKLQGTAMRALSANYGA